MRISHYNACFFIVIRCVIVFPTWAQENILVNPGVDRWHIKTSLPKDSSVKIVSLEELLRLPNPIKKQDARYDSCRIPTLVGKNKLKEGDLITTTGWIHLIALEDDEVKHRDGDYHIQIRRSAQWRDSCLVVEVPYAEFVSDNTLKEKCEKVRAFLRTNFLHGQEPSISGSKLQPASRVVITGQLFFDATHLNGRPRGKMGMRSYTCWEIHPITGIKLAQ